jgi:hypothetical protein
MSTPTPNPTREELARHSLPWLLARWVVVRTKLLWVAVPASRTLARLARLNLEQSRAREAERLDRIRNPHKYRLQP